MLPSTGRHSKTSPQDGRQDFQVHFSSSFAKMTLIPCVSEKLFRPWDSDTASAATPASDMKEEPRMDAASPAASSSSSSGDESETSSTAGQLLTMPFSSAIQQAYSAHMMSAAMAAGHHHHFPYMPWAGTLHRPHHHHYQAEAPSMERFLASLEATPEAIHPSRLAALGMGPNDIGELYQLAGFKPLHHPVVTATAQHSTPSGKKQRPKRFRCPHCQVAFSNNGQLKGHVRSHTGKNTTLFSLFSQTDI